MTKEYQKFEQGFIKGAVALGVEEPFMQGYLKYAQEVTEAWVPYVNAAEKVSGDPDFRLKLAADIILLGKKESLEKCAGQGGGVDWMGMLDQLGGAFGGGGMNGLLVGGGGGSLIGLLLSKALGISPYLGLLLGGVLGGGAGHVGGNRMQQLFQDFGSQGQAKAPAGGSATPAANNAPTPSLNQQFMDSHNAVADDPILQPNQQSDLSANTSAMKALPGKAITPPSVVPNKSMTAPQGQLNVDQMAKLNAPPASPAPAPGPSAPMTTNDMREMRPFDEAGLFGRVSDIFGRGSDALAVSRDQTGQAMYDAGQSVKNFGSRVSDDLGQQMGEAGNIFRRGTSDAIQGGKNLVNGVQEGMQKHIFQPADRYLFGTGPKTELKNPVQGPPRPPGMVKTQSVRLDDVLKSKVANLQVHSMGTQAQEPQQYEQPKPQRAPQPTPQDQANDIDADTIALLQHMLNSRQYTEQAAQGGGHVTESQIQYGTPYNKDQGALNRLKEMGAQDPEKLMNPPELKPKFNISQAFNSGHGSQQHVNTSPAAPGNSKPMEPAKPGPLGFAGSNLQQGAQAFQKQTQKALKASV